MARFEDSGGLSFNALYNCQVEQHTSPFELQQMSTLFANFGKKFKHETVDNIPDLAPAVIVFAGMIA